MARWRLRLFLDAGAGVCLWSQDEATRARFGYAVDHRELGLAPEVVDAVDRLIADHDASVDWHNPGAAGPGGAGAPLVERALELVTRIRQALGPDFDLACDV